MKMINELKTINKVDMFKKNEKPKISLMDKLKIIFGYGKKR